MFCNFEFPVELHIQNKTMNLFWLDLIAKVNAEYHCNEHLKKMPLEAAQMLYSALWKWDPNGKWRETAPFKDNSTQRGYKLCQPHHPVTIWVAKSVRNYDHCVEYGLALCDEYVSRFGVILSVKKHLEFLRDNRPGRIPDLGFTAIPLCIYKRQKGQPPTYEGDFNVVVAKHREYYRNDKKSFATYEPASEPTWMNT
jgi:hypothetical protein